MSLLNLTTIISLLTLCLCNIRELGPEFGDQSKLEQAHLVMFYAPWCSHCKSLHPTWFEVGTKLQKHSIIVARIDATLYRSATEKFNVRGFPTIRLISKDRVVEFVGDRTTEALTKFAIKGSRPLITTVGSHGKLKDLRRSDDVIFLVRGVTEDVRTCLNIVAPQIIHECVIGEVTNNDIIKVDEAAKPTKINELTSLRSDLTTSRDSSVIVLKENSVLEFTGDLENCLQLVEWIKSERFPAYQVGSYPVIHPLLFLKYKIVFYYGESESRIAELQSLATQRESLPDDYYFVSIVKAEFVENLISSYAEIGSITIYDPQTELYSYSTDPVAPIKSIIEESVSENAQLFGGTGVIASVKKVWYRICSNVFPLFTDHPVVMGLVTLLPIGLIVMCCRDGTVSKDEPIKKVRASESHMDLLWANSGDKEVEGNTEDEENEDVDEDEENEDVGEKDPSLKKDE